MNGTSVCVLDALQVARIGDKLLPQRRKACRQQRERDCVGTRDSFQLGSDTHSFQLTLGLLDVGLHNLNQDNGGQFQVQSIRSDDGTDSLGAFDQLLDQICLLGVRQGQCNLALNREHIRRYLSKSLRLGQIQHTCWSR